MIEGINLILFLAGISVAAIMISIPGDQFILGILAGVLIGLGVALQ